MRCAICDTVFEAKSSRAKFCSEACKQKNKRLKGDPITESQVRVVTDQDIPETIDTYPSNYGVSYPITDADKLWWSKNSHMGAEWPNWLPEESQRTCINCKKEFRTNLALLKTCC